MSISNFFKQKLGICENASGFFCFKELGLFCHPPGVHYIDQLYVKSFWQLFLFLLCCLHVFFSGRQTGALNRGWFNCVTGFFWMLLQAFCCLQGKNAEPRTFEGSGYFSNVGSYVKQGSSMVAWGGWPLPEAKMEV